MKYTPIAHEASSFSIRDRIDFSATMVTTPGLSSWMSFSIRDRIDFSATVRWFEPFNEPNLFQYPRSDRLLCYHQVQFKIVRGVGSFSIRDRIDFSATDQ